jgi:amino acid adenylation domain-containing protein/non-ribosomal peptide synthase protein (TIGR01720 family)
MEKQYLDSYNTISLTAHSGINANNTAIDLSTMTLQEKKALARKLLKQQGSGHVKTNQLSCGQASLWFLHQQYPKSASYNEGVALRIKKGANVNAIEAALLQLTSANPILRTIYRDAEGEPFKELLEEPVMDFAVTDATSWTADELREQINIQYNLSFRLDKSVMRARVFTLPQQEMVLMIVIHHIACDGWSLKVLLEEFMQIYSASSTASFSGKDGYDTFIVEEQQYLSSNEGIAALKFWKEQLAGALPQINLPAADTKEKPGGYIGAAVPFTLGKDLSARLNALSRKEEITLYETLLAAFQCLLYRYSNQKDIIVGTPMHNRNSHHYSHVAGYFVNTIAVRKEVNPENSFCMHVKQLQQQLQSMRRYVRYPFSEVVKELRTNRQRNKMPVFQVMFSLQEDYRNQTAMVSDNDLQFEYYNHLHKADEPFDLHLEMLNNKELVSGIFRFNTTAYSTAFIQQLSQHFEYLLVQVLNKPSVSLKDISLIAPAEAAAMLGFCEGPRFDYPVHEGYASLFLRQALLTPDAIAVSDSKEVWTYRELNKWSDTLASLLTAEYNIGNNNVAGVYMERGVRLIGTIIAIWKAGGVYLPLDPVLPTERIQYILQDAGVALVICGEGLTTRIAMMQEISIDTVSTDNDIVYTHEGSKGNDWAYLLYTSGSTGRPKGVMIEQASMINHLCSKIDDLGIKAGSKIAQTASHSFDVSIWQMFTPLLTGAEVKVYSREEILSVESFLHSLSADAIQVVQMVPAFLAEVMEVLEEELPELQFPALQCMVTAGEELRKRLAERLFARIPGIQLLNGYGPTEAADNITVYITKQLPVGTRVPIGRPVSNMRIYVVDMQGAPCPIGVIGEIWASGIGVSCGYVGMPEKTDEVFIEDPFHAGERVYRTGDLGRWTHEGLLEFHGRLDHQVKIRGNRVEPGEIESVMLECEGVKQAAVVYYPGADGGALAAFLVWKEGFTGGTNGLQSLLSDKLPVYMQPASITVMDSFPLTASGKIDRNRLPKPEVTGKKSGEYIAPVTETQKILCRVWEEVMGYSPIGIEDSFFDLGGHSLKGLRLLARVYRECGVRLTINQLFASPTVSQLSVLLEEQHHRFSVIAPQVTRNYYNASPAQRLLWATSKMSSEASAAYNMSGSYMLEGDLNMQAMQQAVDFLTERHESLRTNFRVIEGQLCQVVHPYKPGYIAVEMIDMSNALTEQEVSDYIVAKQQEVFNLETAPLLSVRLVKLGKQKHILLGTLHHLVGDGWSLGVLFRDLSQLYNQLTSTGGLINMEPLFIQYRDYTAWKEKMMDEPEMKTAGAYWKSQFENHTTLSEIPPEYPRPAVKTYNGHAIELELDAATVAGIRRLCGEMNITPFMFLATALNVLLYRYTAQSDLVIGFPVAGREHPDLQDQVGLYINTIALKTSISGNETLRELMLKVKANITKANAYQEYPFEKVLEQLSNTKDYSYRSLLDVLINYQQGKNIWEGLDLRNMRAVPYTGAKFVPCKTDLEFNFFDPGTALAMQLVYNSALFSAAAAGRLLEHFQQALRVMITSPAIEVGAVSLLTEEATNTLATFSTGPVSRYPVHLGYAALFEQQVMKSPDALAVADGHHSWTYNELNQYANRIAARLVTEYEIGQDQVVGVYMERGAALIATMLGIWKAGGVYLPIDPQLPGDRIAYMLADAGTGVVVCGQGMLVNTPGVASLDFNTVIATQPNIIPARCGSNGSDWAYLLYTSGSTGRPKGVMITQGGMINHLFSKVEDLEMNAQTRLAQTASQGFDISLWQMLCSLLAGGMVRVYSRAEVLAVDSFAASLAKEEITIVQMVPAYLAEMMTVLEGKCSQLTFPKLQVVVTAGEVLSKVLASRLFVRLPHIMLLNGYGPTEGADNITVYITRNEPEGSVVPIGRPVSNMRIYVVDTDGRQCPVGVIGEIWASGIGVGRGYIGQPEKTAEVFIADPFNAGERVYRTGDLGRWTADGLLEFHGRKDYQVKMRGYRIELGEIERVMLGCQGVHQAAVVYNASEYGGSLAAYLVWEEGFTGQLEDLQLTLQQNLPAYMLPATITMMDSFPLTPSGKINRNELPKPADTNQVTAGYKAPSGETEILICRLWEEVLGKTGIGTADNFFDIGGHSLNGIRLLSAIEQATGKSISLPDLFTYCTISKQAEFINRSSSTKQPVISRQPEMGRYPVSNAQRRMWVISLLGMAGSSYHISGALEMNGILDMDAWRSAWSMLFNRHEILRTNFEMEDGVIYQRVSESHQWNVPTITYTDISGEKNWKKTFEKRCKLQESKPFNLSKGSLVRASVVKVEEARHIFFFTLHHIIADEWSLEILSRELLSLYESFCHDEPVILPHLRIQYRDYATWQLENLEGPKATAARDYWMQQLSGLLPVLELPHDLPRPVSKTYNGAVECAMMKDVMEQMNGITRTSGTTLFMNLLAAVNVLLFRYTRQEDIIVGVPVTGRDQQDLVNQIGVYINTLALRVSVSGADSYSDVLQKVRTQTLNAFTHRDYPFDKLVDELGTDRDVSRSPVFDVMMVLHDNELAASQLTLTGDELTITPFERPVTGSKFDLAFNFRQSGNDLEIELNYNTDLFTQARVNLIITHLCTLLQSLLVQYQLPVDTLQYTSPEETMQLVHGFQGKGSVITDRNVNGWFEDIAQTYPNGIALAGNDRTYTYAELNTKANQLAHHLCRVHGIVPGSVVALCMDRSVNIVIAMLAVAKAGACFLPVDKTFPTDRVSYMLVNSNTALAICENQSPAGIPVLQWDSTLEQLLEEEITSNPVHPVNIEAPFYIIYTSGSTGKPKGVQIPHRGIVNHAAGTIGAYGITCNDRALLFSSLAFDLCHTVIWSSLLSGAALHIWPEAEYWSPRSVLETLIKEEISFVKLTPSHFKLLLQESNHNNAVTALRVISIGGEKLRPSDMAAWLKKEPGTRFFSSYGPTETSVSMLFQEIAMEADGENVMSISEFSNSPVLGRPLGAHRVYVMDAKQLLCGICIPGELYIGGPGVGLGYINQPELTAERFIPDPYRPGEYIYRTGDMGRWLSDGTIEFLGRVDDQVQVHGYRVEKGEIEHILRACPGIKHAAVKVWEQGSGVMLAAYFTAETELDEEAIRNYLQPALPQYMVPAYFVQLDTIPLTANGKTNIALLPKPVMPEVPEEAMRLPDSKTELLLEAAFKAVLGISRLSMSDNFFRLGGDSIQAIQVSSWLYNAGYKLEVKDIFTHPGAEALAKCIQPMSRITDQETVSGTLPLTPVQHHFFGRNMHTPSYYNQSVMLVSAERLDYKLLEKVVYELQTHHDALRMVFKSDEKGIRQYNCGLPHPVWIARKDLREDSNPVAALSQSAQELQEGIVLETGPLFRVGLYHLPDGDRLLLTAHHLVVDGVSWRIILEDIANLYEQAIQGNTLSLPYKTDSYKKWSNALQVYANSNRFVKDQAYWLTATAEEATPLSTDEAIVTFSGGKRTGSVNFRLSESTTNDLLTRASAALNTEINDILISALGLCLHDVFGSDKVWINLEGHGREEILSGIDIARTVGWFTSLYPLLLNTPADKDMAGYISAVKKALRAIPNKGIGYGLWRYIRDNKEDKQRVAVDPRIVFNYLGRFDTTGHNKVFSVDTARYSNAMDPSEKPAYHIAVLSVISKGQFECTIEFDRQQYSEARMEQMASGFEFWLESLIRFCCDAVNSHTVMAESVETASINWNENPLKITPVAEQPHYQLSLSQRRLWFINQLEENPVVYNSCSALSANGKISKVPFNKAWKILVERHESLRTVFLTVEGEPRQQIVPFNAAIHAVTHIDLRKSSKPQQELEQILHEDFNSSFDLTSGPLFRCKLIRLGTASYVLSMNMHHIICDGWSKAVLNEEFMVIYHACLSGSSNPLAPLSIQYRDFAAWQNKMIQTEGMAAHRGYWLDRFKGELPILQLPTDYPRPKVKVYNSLNEQIYINGNSVAALQAMSDREQVTPFTILLSAVNVLLSRYSGQEDIIVGMPVAGREMPELRNQVGFYLNTIPLRQQVAPEESFVSLIHKVQQEMLGAFEHQAYPFDSLIEDLRIERDTSRSALFDVLVVSEDFHLEPQSKALLQSDTAIEVEEIATAFSANKFDLSFYFRILGDKIELVIGYNASLFSAARINLLTRHFRNLLIQLLRKSEAPVISHQYLEPEEQVEDARVFNNTIAPYSKEKTLHQLFEEQVKRTPEGEALRQNEQSMSYDMLNRKANVLARYLLDMGLQDADNVGIMTHRNFDMITGMYGILKAGGAYVPIDPNYPSDRQQYIIENSGINILVTDDPAHAASIVGEMKQVRIICPANIDAGKYADNDLQLKKNTADLAYTIYTSGSSGRPKGVMIEHHSAVNLVEWVNNEYAVNSNDRLLFITSMCFDLSVYDIFGMLAAGGTLVIATQEDVQDINRLKYLMQSERITFWDSVPTTLNYLVTELAYSKEPFVQPWLRVAFMSGDWIPVSLPPKVKDYFPNVNVISLGGATEGTVWSNYFPIEKVEPHWLSIPYGKPITNNFFYILDNALNPVPKGVIGELFIGGVGVSRGYINDPEKTAYAFMKDPFCSTLGGMMYRTGDLGRMLPDGNMEFLGRKDFQVKIRGYRVELGEIENILSKYPGMETVLVSAAVDKGGIKFLVAYYVSEQPQNRQEMMAFLAGYLPEYMIPGFFIHLESFPLNSNGKIDRKALPQPQQLLEEQAKEMIAPRNKTEEAIAGIWCTILSKDAVSIQDNFFTLGGHSLAAAQVVSRVQEEMGVPIKLRTIFTHPTIEALAAEINNMIWLEKAAAPAVADTKKRMIV